jgi:hypothetical protein
MMRIQFDNCRGTLGVALGRSVPGGRRGNRFGVGEREKTALELQRFCLSGYSAYWLIFHGIGSVWTSREVDLCSHTAPLG